MRVAALNIFPLKSARGVALTESPIDGWGWTRIAAGW